MTAVAIAVRELRERSRLFIICGALALLPFVAGMLPGARADRPGVIATTSSYLALALALGSALVFGASTVMRDMVERRLSFYFSKPVSASAIWWGKAAAALIASYVCFAIISLPAALFVRGWPGPGMWMVEPGQLLVIVFGGVIVVFFAGHLFASVIRSRSVLIAIDFVCAAIAAVVLMLLARPLLIGGAMELTSNLIVTLGAALLLIAVIAPVFQLEKGRTDVRRAHAALSRFLWPAVFLVIGLAAAYVLWVIKASPSDITSVLYLDQAPRGEEVIVAGRMRGRGDYHASFLVGGNGGWRRLGISAFTEPRYSRDGRTVAWFEPVGFKPGTEHELRTNRGPSDIRVNGYVSMMLSDDGTRVSIGQGSLITVYDVASGKILASAGGFDRTLRHVPIFVTNDLLRVVELSYSTPRPAPLRVFELDISRKKLTKTGELTTLLSGTFAATPDGSQLFLRRLRRVVDGRTLATLAELPRYEATSSAMLSDGRVADTVREGKQTRLRIWRGTPAPRVIETLLPIAHAAVVGELADGKLIVRGTHHIGWSATGVARTMFVVDPGTGKIVQTVPQVKGPDADWSDPRLTRYDAPRLAAIDKAGKLVWWDPRTGRVE